MKVIVSDVTHSPASSSEMPSGWTPSLPDRMTAENLWCLSPWRQVWNISQKQRQQSERWRFIHTQRDGMRYCSRDTAVTCGYFQLSEQRENSQLRCEKLNHHKMTTCATFTFLDMSRRWCDLVVMWRFTEQSLMSLYRWSTDRADDATVLHKL